MLTTKRNMLSENLKLLGNVSEFIMSVQKRLKFTMGLEGCKLLGWDLNLDLPDSQPQPYKASLKPRSLPLVPDLNNAGPLPYTGGSPGVETLKRLLPA